MLDNQPIAMVGYTRLAKTNSNSFRHMCRYLMQISSYVVCYLTKEEHRIKYIANKHFYRETAMIAIPIALQSLLSSCLGLIDTMMVARINMVSAVGTATQIDSMNTLLALGATSGTAIFLAQYSGAGDSRNLKKTFGLSVLLSILSGLCFFAASALFAPEIIHFYTPDQFVGQHAVSYLEIIKYSFIPSGLAFAFSYAFRSGKNTKIPLYVSTLKMLLNVVLNYLLIFGKLGFPAMGVQGAAIATVISHWAGVAAYILVSVKTHQPFIGSIKEMFSLELSFIRRVLGRIYSLILNEVFFGFGETLYIKAFATLGPIAMDAYFVGNKISSVFYILIMGLSSAATIMLGNALGKGEIQKAKEQSGYFLGFAGILAVISVLSIILFAKPLVWMFGIENEAVVRLSTQVVQVFAIKIALRLFIVVSFSALRAGGDSKFLTFIDSGVMWLVGIPLTFLIVEVLGVTSIVYVLLFVQLEHLVRMLIGVNRLKSGKWAVNLTLQN